MRPALTPEAAAVADAVSLERGPCFGTCPVYTVTLDRSGSVRFTGTPPSCADSGDADGTIPRAAGGRLFGELEAAGYFDFADAYERTATCGPTPPTCPGDHESAG